MAYELVYTSAPEGLNRGSSGFCVVACTKGLGPRLVVTLEGLSAYKPLYPHYAPNAWDNPVSRSHYIYEANGERQHILSRICFNGVDHTGRSNKLASHLVLSGREAAIAQGGPSSLLLREELFKDAAWPIKAEYFAKQREIPQTAVQVRKCTLWESVMGDAGWAGWLAQTYIDTPNKNVYLAYNPEQHKDILPLLHEAMSLLPAELRWKITFNTYFVNLPAGMSCTWRCCPADSDALRASRRSPMNIVIDITKPQALNQEGKLISSARTGIAEQPEEQAVAAADAEPEVISLDNAELPNRTVYLHMPEKEHVLDPAGQPEFVPPCRVENEDHAAVVSAWAKLLLTILTIIVLLAATIGGVFYFVSVTRERHVRMEEYGRLKDVYVNARKSFGDIRNEANAAKTEKEITDVRKKIERLTQELDSVKKEAKKLKPHQKLFEKAEENRKNEEKPDSVEIKEDLEGIAKNCSGMETELETIKTALEEKRKKISGQAAEKKTDSARPKSSQSAPLDHTNTLPPSRPHVPGKTAPAENPAAKTSKKESGPINKLTEDDPRYLWTKSEEFHTMIKNQFIRVQLGKCAPDKISIHLLPDMKKQPINSRFFCEQDQDAREAEIETKFDQAKGILTFTLKNQFSPSKQTEILIKLGNRKVLPLYFKLGISRIKPNEIKAMDNVLISIEDTVKVSIKDSSMRFPGFGRIYAEDNSLCRRELVTLCLNCPDYKKIKLEEAGDRYVFEDGDSKLREQRSKLKALDDIEEKFRKEPMEFVQMAPEKLEKESQKYAQLSAAVNDEEIRLKIEKLFDRKAAAAPSAGELMEKIRKNPRGRKEKWLKSWKDQYDALQKVSERIVRKLKTEIPLNQLGYDKYTGTFEEEKAAAGQKLRDRKLEIENAVRKSTVTLSYRDREYEQFPLKKILQ